MAQINKNQTRRQFLLAAGIGAAVSLAEVNCALAQKHKKAEKKLTESTPAGVRRFELGLASFSFRKFSLDETLAITQKLGLKYICLKSFHLPLESSPEEIEAVAKKVKQAGLELYGGGVISMKTEAEVHRAFEYAKTAGMKVIIGTPSPKLLELVNKKIQEYDIKVAIHNHGPTDKIYPTDERIGLCHDIGHTQRAGMDPAEVTLKCADRLLDVHMKDVSQATEKGHTVPIGRGVIDIVKFLRTLLKINYAGVASFEYESDNPLEGTAESVGFVRGVLAAI
ncbi:MAG: sugar phosphate isomerase/epimerase family protein [Planctomycetota bacterium]|jgi:sugar phosphate isomerase/epimerase